MYSSKQARPHHKNTALQLKIQPCIQRFSEDTEVVLKINLKVK